ncbi:MAG: quinone-dependent dihydroorotate dehydrogenase [Pseudomonadales bacterium]|jgi:dihydroorotate dehydrogenase
MSYSLLRNLMFRFDAETSHNLGLKGLSLAERLKLSQIFVAPMPQVPVHVMGLEFPNPVGLAAGLDKNGEHIDGLAALGFGFLEIGTITPRPQPGNPQPRLFRLANEKAIINRMGFNNKGVDYLLERVRASKFDGVLGINIGKNFDTPVENALDDYLICLRKVYQDASYITVNLSSPNTPGLRTLQFGDTLRELLTPLKEEQRKLAERYESYKPLAVKIAPDMTDDEVAMVARTLVECEIDGVIATNTTISRVGVENSPHKDEAGGLSGKPLTQAATRTVKALADELNGTMPIIAAGGIMDADSAQQKIDAGASLVQVYTGFIYRGPHLVREIVEQVKL